MCSQCENCVHSKFSRGAVRGVMDCDPDEYWCDANEDEYYYSDDDEIRNELFEELSEEEKAETDIDDIEIDCPGYSYFDPYEYEESMRDGPYDTVKEAEGLA